MVVLKRRSMLVTFRVSSDEHAALTKSCMESGARSIADFARAAVLQRVQTLHAPSGDITGDLTTLTKSLRELDTHMATLRRRILAILGPVSSRLNASNEAAAVMVEKNDA
jgi:hypothetical protein